jgi:hypothetical protein
MVEMPRAMMPATGTGHQRWQKCRTALAAAVDAGIKRNGGDATILFGGGNGGSAGGTANGGVSNTGGKASAVSSGGAGNHRP